MKIATLFSLRVLMGWLFLYAGLTKVLDPAWSAVGYLTTAKTFGGLYQWLASPQILPLTNLVNEWGLTILGALLIAGFLVRFAAPAAAVMMILYYLPILSFPYAGEHSFLVDEHIIYAAGFMLLGAWNAGKAWGVDGVLHMMKKK